MRKHAPHACVLLGQQGCAACACWGAVWSACVCRTAAAMSASPFPRPAAALASRCYEAAAERSGQACADEQMRAPPRLQPSEEPRPRDEPLHERQAGAQQQRAPAACRDDLGIGGLPAHRQGVMSPLSACRSSARQPLSGTTSAEAAYCRASRESSLPPPVCVDLASGTPWATAWLSCERRSMHMLTAGPAGSVLTLQEFSSLHVSCATHAQPHAQPHRPHQPVKSGTLKTDWPGGGRHRSFRPSR